MNTFKKLLAGVAALVASAAAFGQADTETGTLDVTVVAGALEIVGGVAGSHAPTGGPFTTSGAAQTDAVAFAVDGIEIDDFDGNGNGFFVDVTPPSTLDNVGATASLTIGTIGGLNNAQDGNGGSDTTISTVSTTNDRATYNVGAGIDGFLIDYDVSYTIPAFAPADSYSGTLTVEVTSL